jgi:hypothetical protein
VQQVLQQHLQAERQVLNLVDSIQPEDLIGDRTDCQVISRTETVRPYGRLRLDRPTSRDDYDR